MTRDDDDKPHVRLAATQLQQPDFDTRRHTRAFGCWIVCTIVVHSTARMRGRIQLTPVFNCVHERQHGFNCNDLQRDIRNYSKHARRHFVQVVEMLIHKGGTKYWLGLILERDGISAI